MNKCPVCESEGAKSVLDVSLWGVSTAMPEREYYDEEGKPHHHDPNSHTRKWSCSHGHSGSITTRGGCPTCKDFHSEVHVNKKEVSTV